MNALAAASTRWEAPLPNVYGIEVGSRWVLNDRSPFGVAPDALVYTILEVKDGWLRFQADGSCLEHRSSVEEFQRYYLPLSAPPSPSHAKEQIRAHYALMVKLTQQARDALKTALLDGVPRIARSPNGGMDGMDGVRQARVVELINNFSRANRALWSSAEHLCEIEGYKDDGENDGVVWEIAL